MSTPYSPLTTHVLDTAQGRPAKKMQISLHRKDESSESWHLVKQGETNDDGRLAGLVTKELFSAGTYKMRFETGSYFSALNTETFYPYVEVVFEIKKTNEHYHVPLLVSPYGFSTYRGS